MDLRFIGERGNDEVRKMSDPLTLVSHTFYEFYQTVQSPSRFRIWVQRSEDG